MTAEQQRTRPDKHDYASLAGDTWAVHGGNHPDATTGAIRTPIIMAKLLPPAPGPDDDR